MKNMVMPTFLTGHGTARFMWLFPPEIIIVIRFLNLGSTPSGASIDRIYLDETIVHRANARDYSTDRSM
jgi:hypothetical protein